MFFVVSISLRKMKKLVVIPVILGGQEPAYYIDRANHIGEIVAVALEWQHLLDLFLTG